MTKVHRAITHEKFSWQILAASTWLILTLSLGLYAILKASPTAHDFHFLPSRLATWLDANYDLRTFVMAFAVSFPPAVLLRAPRYHKLRISLLAICLVVLTLAEIAQTQLITRSFSVPDLLYTLGGITVVEVCCRLGNFLFSAFPFFRA
jgi:VanZ family protein